MPASRDTQPDLLHEVYKKRIVRQFPLWSILLQIIGRDTQNVAQGDHLRLDLHAGTGGGPTFNSAGYTPPADQEQVDKATFNYRWMIDHIELLEDLVQDTKGGAPAAAVSALDLEVNALIPRCRHAMNFTLFGNGDGVVATPTAASSATVITVDSLRGLRKNMRVDILVQATGIVGAGGVQGAKIAINRQNKTITLQGGATLADGTGADLNANAANYRIYRSGARNDAWFGLDAAISASNPPSGVGNYGGIDRTNDANDFWRAPDHGHGGVVRAPELKLIQDLLDDIGEHGEGRPQILITHPKIWSALVERADSDRRYRGETTMLNGWATAFKFAAIDQPIVRDFHCQEDRIYAVDPSSFTIYQSDGGSWYDKGGGMWHKVQGRLAMEAAWSWRGNLICERPGANGVLRDLAYLGAAA